MFFALLWSTSAHAGVDQAALERMVASAALRMRTLTGAALSPPPRALVTTRDGFLAAHPPAGPDDHALADALTSTTLSYYSAQDNQVVLLSDSFSAALASAQVRPDDVDPLVQCAVAHELVHAAQNELGLLATPASMPVEALREGQAEELSRPLCPQPFRERYRMLRSVDIPGARPDSHAAWLNSAGTRLSEELERRFGSGATWAVLRYLARPDAEPLTVEDLDAVALEGGPSGWAAWTGPEDAARSLLGGTQPSVAQVNPYLLAGTDQTLVAVAGRSATVHTSATWFRTFGFWMVDAGAARRWVALREAASTGERPFAPFSAVPSVTLDFGSRHPMRLRMGPTDTAARFRALAGATRVETGGTMRSLGMFVYEEDWIARGNLVVGVVGISRDAVDLPGAVRRMLDGAPAAVDTGEALSRVYARLARIADATCARGYSEAEIDAATRKAAERFANLDSDGFAVAQRAMESALTCATDPLSAPTIARIHEIEAFAAFLSRHIDAERGALAAVYATEPTHTLDQELVPPGHPITRQVPRAQSMVRTDPGQDLTAPSSGESLVDGQPATRSPRNRPYVLQQLNDSGDVVSSRYIWPTTRRDLTASR